MFEILREKILSTGLGQVEALWKEVTDNANGLSLTEHYQLKSLLKLKEQAAVM